MIRPELKRSKMQVVSREKDWLGKLETFPNPVAESLRIRFPWETTSEVRFLWRNLTGQMVREEKGSKGNTDYQISCPETSGLYLLQIQTGDQFINRKIQVCR